MLSPRHISLLAVLLFLFVPLACGGESDESDPVSSESEAIDDDGDDDDSSASDVDDDDSADDDTTDTAVDDDTDDGEVRPTSCPQGERIAEGEPGAGGCLSQITSGSYLNWEEEETVMDSILTDDGQFQIIVGSGRRIEVYATDTIGAKDSGEPEFRREIVAQTGKRPAITVDGDGVRHAAWYDARHRRLLYANDASGEWIPEIVDDNTYTSGSRPSIAVDGQETVHLVYRSGRYATNASGKWEHRDPFGTASYGDSSIAVGADQKVYAWFGNSGALAQLEDGEWTLLEPIEETYQSDNGRIRVAPDGKIHLARWEKIVEVLEYNTYSPGVGWVDDDLRYRTSSLPALTLDAQGNAHTVAYVVRSVRCDDCENDKDGICIPEYCEQKYAFRHTAWNGAERFDDDLIDLHEVVEEITARMAPDGRLHAAWLTYDEFEYALLEEGVWRRFVIAADDSKSAPGLAFEKDQIPHVVYATQTGVFDLFRTGDDWRQREIIEVPVETYPKSRRIIFRPRNALADASGTVHAFFYESARDENLVWTYTLYHAFLVGDRWERQEITPTDLPDPSAGKNGLDFTVGLTAAGEVYLIYLGNQGIRAAVQKDGQWSDYQIRDEIAAPVDSDYHPEVGTTILLRDRNSGRISLATDSSGAWEVETVPFGVSMEDAVVSIAPDRRIFVAARRENGGVFLAVKDNGSWTDFSWEKRATAGNIAMAIDASGAPQIYCATGDQLLNLTLRDGQLQSAQVDSFEGYWTFVGVAAIRPDGTHWAVHTYHNAIQLFEGPPPIPSE